MKFKNKKDILPDYAVKVFRGVIFDIYQWDQEQFDGRKKLFELGSRLDTVVIIPVVDDKFIINHEEQPNNYFRTGFPMGRLDFESEDVVEAALREYSEETGITPKKLFHVITEQPIAKILWNIHTFIAVGEKEKHDIALDGGEKIENKHISFDEAYNMMKNLELEIPKLIMKPLLNETKKQFLDRFSSPEKYFEEIKL